jgi:hypothetical protein
MNEIELDLVDTIANNYHLHTVIYAYELIHTAISSTKIEVGYIIGKKLVTKDE